jgi:hypothetical protein
MKAKLRKEALENLIEIKIGRRVHHCLEHPVYKGYFVSTLGKVISCVSDYRAFDGQIRGDSKPKVKKTHLNEVGYEVVQISLGDGTAKPMYVHRLVAETFFELPDEAPDLLDPLMKPTRSRNEVNHIDGEKANNKVSNLEWVSHQENGFHERLLALIKAERRCLRWLTSGAKRSRKKRSQR